MEPKKITATELARSLSDVLSRVHYRGETFIVERNGDVVATLAPPEPKPQITFRELVKLLRERHKPLEGFADDLEEIQASQPKIGPPPSWDD